MTDFNTIENAVLNGALQAGAGVVSGHAVDFVAPELDPTKGPLMIAGEVLVQIAIGAGATKLVGDLLTPSNSRFVDPTGGIYFGHTFLKSQRKLNAKLEYLSGVVLGEFGLQE